MRPGKVHALEIRRGACPLLHHVLHGAGEKRGGGRAYRFMALLYVLQNDLAVAVHDLSVVHRFYPGAAPCDGAVSGGKLQIRHTA